MRSALASLLNRFVGFCFVTAIVCGFSLPSALAAEEWQVQAAVVNQDEEPVGVLGSNELFPSKEACEAKRPDLIAGAQLELAPHGVKIATSLCTVANAGPKA